MVTFVFEVKEERDKEELDSAVGDVGGVAEEVGSGKFLVGKEVEIGPSDDLFLGVEN